MPDDAFAAVAVIGCSKLNSHLDQEAKVSVKLWYPKSNVSPENLHRPEVELGLVENQLFDLTFRMFKHSGLLQREACDDN